MCENDRQEAELLRRSVIDMAVEAWRFRRVFEKAVGRLDPGERGRYYSQFSWFMKKVEAALQSAGLRLVSAEGQLFDVGMAVTPLNLSDFGPEDVLYVEQMPEPIVMDDTHVVRTGTVILRRAEG